MVVLGYLNARVGNVVAEGTVRQHGVPGRNEVAEDCGVPGRNEVAEGTVRQCGVTERNEVAEGTVRQWSARKK